MKRLFSYLLLGGVIGAGYAMYVNKDLGLMQVQFAEYRLEATLFEIGAGVLALLLAYMFASYGFQLLIRIASTVGEKRNQRQVEKAQQSQEHGQIELAEGHYLKAEKLFLQKIEHNQDVLTSYMGAARAAHMQGADNRRDDHLRQAQIKRPDAAVAVGLTQAELQLDHDQLRQAMATMTHLNERAPQHPAILNLLATTHSKLEDWESLRGLLPEIQRAGAVSDEKLLALEINTWSGLIERRAKTADIDSLMLLWEEIPRNIKAVAEVVEHYANELIRLHAAGEAERVLREQLSRHWAASIIMLYAELDVMATTDQVSTLEGWLQHHPNDEYLLLALGKALISIGDRGKARSYLEASLAIAPMPVTYLKLAQLLEDHMDNREQAQEYYRQGLHVLTGDYGEAVLANAANDFQRVMTQPELRVI
jgi:HemY protein